MRLPPYPVRIDPESNRIVYSITEKNCFHNKLQILSGFLRLDIRKVMLGVGKSRFIETNRLSYRSKYISLAT